MGTAGGVCSADVRRYGARGDGVADDTAPIQAALNANAGGTVCFPSGIYQISHCLLVPSLTTLVGAGPVNRGYATTEVHNTVLRLTSAGTTSCMLTPSNIKDGNYQEFSLRDMTIDGGAGNGGFVAAGGAYIDLQNTYDMTSLNDIMVANVLNAPAIRIGPGLAGIGTGPILKLDHVWINGFTQATIHGAAHGFNNQVGLEIDNYYGSPEHTGWVNGGVISNVEISGTGTAPAVHVRSLRRGGMVRWFVFEGLAVTGIAEGSTAGVLIDGMSNSTFRDSFFGLPAHGTAFLISKSNECVGSSNLLFEGVFNDGAEITFLKDQTKGTTRSQPVETYMLR
jgi:hypothetical protein